MTLPTQLESERLILRRWKESDKKPFADLNTDPRVMEYFPRILSREEAEDLADYIEACFDKYNYGLWAVERKDNHNFIGFVGLWKPTFKAFFTPCVEIGWRLSFENWGHGFAPEAAMLSLADGFTRLKLKEIVSFTSLHNKKSIRVMEKIGLIQKGEFDHPTLPKKHFLKRHVLYAMSLDNWRDSIKTHH